MLFCFIKQTFFTLLYQGMNVLCGQKPPRGPGSDMGHVSQPHMDVDSGYLVYSAVPNLLLDVMDLITLRGGLACPALLPVNSDGPSINIILILFAFLLFCSVLLRNLAHRKWQKYFIFASRELIG